MSGIVGLIRNVVAQEIGSRRSALLGVVTSVFAHTDKNDHNNYEVNVKLKYEDLELRKVPIATGYVGFAAPPRTGDLVIVQFIDGDLNQPIVSGRFYHADERAPIFKEDEILFEQRVPDGTLNHMRFKSDGTILIQRAVTKPEDNSAAKTSIRIDGSSGDLQITAGDSIVLSLKNDSQIEITANGKPLKVKCDKMTVTGNVEIDGDLVVSNGAQKTTISGNNITGG
jgi:phage baseplate assembly protein gpV